jgi:hypothetical protein
MLTSFEILGSVEGRAQRKSLSTSSLLRFDSKIAILYTYTMKILLSQWAPKSPLAPPYAPFGGGGTCWEPQL